MGRNVKERNGSPCRGPWARSVVWTITAIETIRSALASHSIQHKEKSRKKKKRSEAGGEEEKEEDRALGIAKKLCTLVCWRGCQERIGTYIKVIDFV